MIGSRTNFNRLGRLPQLRGYDCAYDYAAAGLSPKHTIYAFSICIIEIRNEKETKINKKAGIGP